MKNANQNNKNMVKLNFRRTKASKKGKLRKRKKNEYPNKYETLFTFHL